MRNLLRCLQQKELETNKWPCYSFFFLLLKLLSAFVPRVPTHCCPKFNPMSSFFFESFSETWIRTQPLQFLSSSKTTLLICQDLNACRRDTKFSTAESLRKISSKLTQDDDIVFNQQLIGSNFTQQPCDCFLSTKIRPSQHLQTFSSIDKNQIVIDAGSRTRELLSK